MIRLSSRPRPAVLTAALVSALGLALSCAFTSCERHLPGEPALWYGHGSAKPGTKVVTDPHRYDGHGRRFSDTQGTEVAPVEHGRAGEGADMHSHPGAPTTHENPNQHAPPGKSGGH